MTYRNVFGVPTDAYFATASFTPAANSHVAGDVHGGAQEFKNIAPNGGGNIIITGAALEIAGGTAEATAWTLYLYTVTPPSALADDAPWDVPAGDRAPIYTGLINLGTAVDLGTTQWVEVVPNKPIQAATSSLFGYLVNGTTLTPAAVAHKVTLWSVGV